LLKETTGSFDAVQPTPDRLLKIFETFMYIKQKVNGPSDI